MRIRVRPRTKVLALLFVLGFLVYFNAVFHPFVHDDVPLVQLNSNIARWDDLGEVFFAPGVPLASVKLTTLYYRPVLEIINRVQYLFFGGDPAGFHFFNIVLHGLNAGLVFLLALFLRINRTWAFFVAVIFLVHPVQSEAVACISGISNLVVTFFALSTLLVFLKARGISGFNKVIWQSGALAIFVLALFSKEQAVAIPFLILVYECLWGRSGGKERPGAWGPFFKLLIFPAVFFVMTGVYLSLRMMLFPGVFQESFGNTGDLILRLQAIPGTLLMYIGLVFWPAGLHYYRSVDMGLDQWPAILSFAFLAVFLVLVCLAMPQRYRRWSVFGLVWFFVTLLPSANIIALINELSLIQAAEHFLYLPLVGLLIFLAAVAAWMFSRFRGLISPVIGRLILIVIVIVCGALTLQQNRFWCGEIPLFERAVAYEPGLGRVHLLLARAYAGERRFSEALSEYAVGLQIMKDHVNRSGSPGDQDIFLQFVKAAHFDRGLCYKSMGDLSRSNEEYLASLAIRLKSLKASSVQDKDSITASNLAMNYLFQGYRENARKYLRRAIQLKGNNPEAMNNLGMLCLEGGEGAMARFWFNRALKSEPGFRTARENLKRLIRIQK